MSAGLIAATIAVLEFPPTCTHQKQLTVINDSLDVAAEIHSE